jgi:hypothetical protein
MAAESKRSPSIAATADLQEAAAYQLEVINLPGIELKNEDEIKISFRFKDSVSETKSWMFVQVLDADVIIRPVASDMTSLSLSSISGGRSTGISIGRSMRVSREVAKNILAHKMCHWPSRVIDAIIYFASSAASSSGFVGWLDSDDAYLAMLKNGPRSEHVRHIGDEQVSRHLTALREFDAKCGAKSYRCYEEYTKWYLQAYQSDRLRYMSNITAMQGTGGETLIYKSNEAQVNSFTRQQSVIVEEGSSDAGNANRLSQFTRSTDHPLIIDRIERLVRQQ